ncbi:protein lin-28 homolog B isoform X6 [Symphalangus syndactylus]|uniref:protein lin-28 homolog B isoform X6 n=2 Tax=Symphalangus syndactylus TaxID=9590 RepID=UPI00244136C5|nr:protein lin-28 homolog B isoform X3 [Symphalangus syndactylus]
MFLYTNKKDTFMEADCFLKKSSCDVTKSSKRNTCLGAVLCLSLDMLINAVRFCCLRMSKLFMEGFRSLKEGEPVEFTFKKSSKGLESIRVTGPGGSPCLGSERRPKGKTLQKRKPKGDRCYNCGGLDHHAKECSLPPQPKKCHYCQSIMHMVANCPHKNVAQPPASSQGRQEAESQPCTSTLPREVGGGHGCTSPPFPQEARAEISERSGRSPQEASSTKSSTAPEEQSKKGPSVQKRKKT